jgi:hypothetical protein
VHGKNVKNKNNHIANNILAVRVKKKSKHKTVYFLKINKGSNAENFSTIGATFGVSHSRTNIL